MGTPVFVDCIKKYGWFKTRAAGPPTENLDKRSKLYQNGGQKYFDFIPVFRRRQFLPQWWTISTKRKTRIIVCQDMKRSCAKRRFWNFLSVFVDKCYLRVYYIHVAVMAQAVEHVLGKDEVTSSNLVNSSRNASCFTWSVFCFFPAFFPWHFWQMDYNKDKYIIFNQK